MKKVTPNKLSSQEIAEQYDILRQIFNMKPGQRPKIIVVINLTALVLDLGAEVFRMISQ